MKKNNQDTKLLNFNVSSNNDLEIDRIKTTNVNILLNRVRLDQKRTIKKKIVFSIILTSLVSALTVYFVI